MANNTISASWAITNGSFNIGHPMARLSSGRLVAFVFDDTAKTYNFFYSDDDGDTWSALTGTVAGPSNGKANASIAITPDDEIHFAFGSGVSPSVYPIRTGTISGTTITWGDIHGNGWGGTNQYFSDMVAWRIGTVNYMACLYWEATSERLEVGIHSKIDSQSWTDLSKVFVAGIASYGQGSIDFYHTGDGKTLQGGTPHLFVAYAGDSLLGANAKFAKLTYAAGPTWTVGYATLKSGGVQTMTTVAEDQCPTLIFDGTRVVAAYHLTSSPYIGVYERDAANTTTTDRTPATPGGACRTIGLSFDDATEDFVVGAVLESDEDLYTNLYDRSGAAYDGWSASRRAMTNFGSMATGARYRFGLPFATFITSDGAGATDTTFTTADAWNADPSAPTIDAPLDGSAQDVAETLTIDWVFNDPDAGDTQSAYTLRRRIGAGAYNYWNGTSWQASEDASTKIATSTTQQVLSASWGADGDADHYYSVKTWDALDAGPSPWSSETRVIPSAQDNPTLTAPTGVVGPSETATWTVATQTAYRVVVSDTSSTADMDAGTLEYDSGWVTSGSTSQVVTFPTNSVTRYVRVQTKNDEGLVSDIDENTVTVTFTPPDPATVTVTADSDNGRIQVSINNPGTGQPEVSNDVYRRVVGETTAIRVAVGVAVDGSFDDYAVASGVNYEYRVLTHADNSTTAWSSWSS